MVWRFLESKGIWLEINSKISWAFHWQTAPLRHFMNTKTFPFAIGPSKLSGAGAPGAPNAIV
jgi:hypothetical protein